MHELLLFAEEYVGQSNSIVLTYLHIFRISQISENNIGSDMMIVLSNMADNQKCTERIAK